MDSINWPVAFSVASSEPMRRIGTHLTRRLSVSAATIFLLQHLQFLTHIPDPLFGLFGFRPRQPVVATESPFAGIDPAVLLKLAKNLKKEAVQEVQEAFSSEASLEEDIEAAYYDEEPESEREVVKKQKGARFLDGLLKGAGDFFGNPLGAIGNVIKGVFGR